MIDHCTFNAAGEALLKSHEGLKLAPYRDAAGVWTIGYGHTHGVTANTAAITVEQADALLQWDIQRFETIVRELVSEPLNENEFSALVCLVFNVGSLPLQRTLGHKLSLGDYQGAADEFLKWDHAGGKVVLGLQERRAAERTLFLTPVSAQN
jgi:lysozyme